MIEFVDARLVTCVLPTVASAPAIAGDASRRSPRTPLGVRRETWVAKP